MRARGPRPQVVCPRSPMALTPEAAAAAGHVREHAQQLLKDSSVDDIVWAPADGFTFALAVQAMPGMGWCPPRTARRLCRLLLARHLASARASPQQRVARSGCQPFTARSAPPAFRGAFHAPLARLSRAGRAPLKRSRGANNARPLACGLRSSLWLLARC